MAQDFLNPFLEALSSGVNSMTGQNFSIPDALEEASHELDAPPGVASVVGFTGQVKGRCILWAPASLALALTEWVTGEAPDTHTDEMVLFTMAELNNVLSGHAITNINNAHNLDLRLSPPSIFAGEGFSVTTPKLQAYSATASLEGQEGLVLNIAAEGVPKGD